MKTLTLLASLILFPIVDSAHAQSDEMALIEETIGNYLDGSSYNKLAQLESAFANDATLYLNVRGTASRLTPKEYIKFFEDREEGSFNGRVGNLLSVDLYNDIATAKAEILITERGMRYVDLFLLKKLEGQGWKIISKTATITHEAEQ